VVARVRRTFFAGQAVVLVLLLFVTLSRCCAVKMSYLVLEAEILAPV